jgi:hypothetical protein
VLVEVQVVYDWKKLRPKIRMSREKKALTLKALPFVASWPPNRRIGSASPTHAWQAGLLQG